MGVTSEIMLIGRLGVHLAHPLLLSCSITLSEVSCHIVSYFWGGPCGEEMISPVNSQRGPEATNSHVSDLRSGPHPYETLNLEVPC